MIHRDLTWFRAHFHGTEIVSEVKLLIEYIEALEAELRTRLPAQPPGDRWECKGCGAIGISLGRGEDETNFTGHFHGKDFCPGPVVHPSEGGE